jgi:ornithine carbamoyltransferase
LNLLQYKKQKPFSQKHLLKLQDYTTDEILQVLSLALELKTNLKQGQRPAILSGKTLGMIFSKSSTRTRVSFETGMYQLGGYPMFLSTSDIQLGRGEPISDTAKVLSRYLDGIMIRTFNQEDVEQLAEHGNIPIINGLTDKYHPCQVLADLLTIYEHKNQFKGLKLCYAGDGNNMAHSLLEGCAKVGMDIAIASPEGYMPEQEIIETAMISAKKNNCKILITNNPKEAILDADIVYGDVWTSMGQEIENAERLLAFKDYQINNTLFSKAKKDAIFMHCLPAHRGEEVTSEVIDSKNSVIYDQAENRLHVQKAVMVLLLGGL